MRRIYRQPYISLVVLLGLLLPLSVFGPAANASPTITEYPVPPTDNGFADTSFIAKGPDGNMWFTQSIENDIGSISPSGLVKIYTGLDQNMKVGQITSGPDGALWFTQGSKNTALYGGEIGRITTSGGITEFPLDSPYISAGAITSGPDGALWFLEGGPGVTAVGRIDTSGQITNYPVPNTGPNNGDNLTAITSGPDDNLWFVDSTNASINSITTGGTIKTYPVQTLGSSLQDIALGADGALWFTDGTVNKIGRITTDGTVTEYTVPSQVTPQFITPGPDGALWFTESNSNFSNIGRITTDGSITEYPTPTQSSGALGIVSGPGGIWFTEMYVNNIGFVSTTPLATLGTPVWSVNPVQLGDSTTLSVPVSGTEEISGGEYFIGTDPGQGNGIPMPFNSSTGDLSATFTTGTGSGGLGAGVYSIGVRAINGSGNWSPVTTTTLVVTDSNTSLGITGKNKKDLVPSLTNGDIMPGLISNTQTDAADYGMAVQYKNGVLDPHNGFKFTYNTGTDCNKSTAQNCHSFSLNATSFDWMTIGGTNNSQGWFQGTASVTVDGTTTSNPFYVAATDGGSLSPFQDDHIIIKVYAPGADPSSATPIYQASGSISSINSVKIQ